MAKVPKIQQWHIDIVEERMKEYQKNPYPLRDAIQVLDEIISELEKEDDYLPFEEAKKEIEKVLHLKSPKGRL